MSASFDQVETQGSDFTADDSSICHSISHETQTRLRRRVDA